MRDLGPTEVETIGQILGKPIERIAMIQHKFFCPIGYTVRLHLADSGAAYSEAHAGSGEYAIVRLVDAIRSAPERSLILLDEPEVSLHPGAQAELLRFIEREVLAHGHQVVLSTHSPSLAAGLPPVALKVLGFDSTQQRIVLVADGCSPTEAFFHLGHTMSGLARPRLIVEDDLSAEIVKASLRRHAPTRLDTMEIVVFPGGADGIVQNVLPALAIGGIEKAAILLDGDQLPASFDSGRDVLADATAAAARDDRTALKQLWKDQFHQTAPNLHSNTDGGRDMEILSECITWADEHLGFVPGCTPEEALAEAASLLNGAPGSGMTYWKVFWVDRTRSELHLTAHENPTAPQILSVQVLELARLDPENQLLIDVNSTVDRILDW